MNVILAIGPTPNIELRDGQSDHRLGMPVVPVCGYVDEGRARFGRLRFTADPFLGRLCRQVPRFMQAQLDRIARPGQRVVPVVVKVAVTVHVPTPGRARFGLPEGQRCRLDRIWQWAANFRTHVCSRRIGRNMLWAVASGSAVPTVGKTLGQQILIHGSYEVSAVGCSSRRPGRRRR